MIIKKKKKKKKMMMMMMMMMMMIGCHAIYSAMSMVQPPSECF